MTFDVTYDGSNLQILCSKVALSRTAALQVAPRVYRMSLAYKYTFQFITISIYYCIHLCRF